MEMERVGFVGDLREGSIPRQILNMGNCEISLWQPDADNGGEALEEFDGRLVDIDELSDLPLIVVSAGIARCRRLARRLGDAITGRQVLVHTIRGLESGTMNTASKIFAEETPTRRIGFVTGPMRLDDLQAGRPAAAVCASRFPEVHELVEESMMSDRFRVYHSRDMYGAELSAIYARLISLMSGLADSLQLGASLQATLFARGLAEMARFICALEASERTAYGLSGVGNLYVDTLQEGDVDFQMGCYLAEDSTCDADELVEAFGQPAEEILNILDTFIQASQRAEVEPYLLEAVDSLVTTPMAPPEALTHLMGLPAFEE